MFNHNLSLLISTMGLLLLLVNGQDERSTTSSQVDFFDVEPKINTPMSEINQSETKIVPHTTGKVLSEIIINKGRGHLHRRRKILKHLHPFLMAALFAKLIIVPLVLKVLIAMTSSAFVMSKIALVISTLIALSWLLGATRERAKLQIVQYPGANGLKKTFGGWNVQEKFTPNSQYDAYNGWAYDDGVAENNDKNFFL